MKLLACAVHSVLPLARLTRLPLVDRLVERVFFVNDRAIYLPRDRVIPVDEAVVDPESIVLPSEIVESLIRASSHRLIMDTCICRRLGKCQDYPLELGCIFLGEAVLTLNPQLGHLVTVEQALTHAARCREADLVHMVGRIKFDSLVFGAHPAHKLLGICSCCPCCCILGVAPQLAPQIGDRISRLPGVMVRVTDRCVGCGTCSSGVCFVDAIRQCDGHAVISDICRGCGRCVDVCPNDAIELSIESESAMEQVVEMMQRVVDISSQPDR